MKKSRNKRKKHLKDKNKAQENIDKNMNTGKGTAPARKDPARKSAAKKSPPKKDTVMRGTAKKQTEKEHTAIKQFEIMSDSKKHTAIKHDSKEGAARKEITKAEKDPAKKSITRKERKASSKRTQRVDISGNSRWNLVMGFLALLLISLPIAWMVADAMTVEEPPKIIDVVNVPLSAMNLEVWAKEAGCLADAQKAGIVQITGCTLRDLIEWGRRDAQRLDWILQKTDAEAFLGVASSTNQARISFRAQAE
ncbi:MAG: hypothetical protein ACYTG7_16075, partial [Planctomycetota bacterium]